MNDDERSDPSNGSPEHFLSGAWRKLNEHRVAQWTVGYVAVAYGIQHAVVLTQEAFHWPEDILRISMLLLALGVPLAMTFAWYHGDSANRRISAGELSIVSVLLVCASLLFYVFVQPSAEGEATPAVREAGVASTRSPPALPNGGISLAVLPFVNLSSDKEQEFFSDGMTEEITAALAQVKDLRVVGRTSAFAFKGKSEDLRSIAQALGATHIIEGSVRKAGNQLRITAQLIRAGDDSHLWAQNYDRELTDVFAIQEDIAKAIAASLQVPLGLKQGEKLVSSRTSDTETYEDYLRAKALVRARNNGGTLYDAIALLERVVARDPNYATGWALLAQAYALAPNYDPVYQTGTAQQLRRVAEASLPKAEAAARKAIQLDRRNADGYTSLAISQQVQGKWIDAEASLKQALALDPLNPDTLQFYSQQIALSGRVRDGVAMRAQLRSVEPFVPVFNSVSDRLLWVAGENDDALALAAALLANYTLRSSDIARIYAAMGRTKDAAQAIMDGPRAIFAPGAPEAAAAMLRNAPAAAPNEKLPYLGKLSFSYLYAHAPERALEDNERNAEAGYLLTADAMLIWQKDYAPARKTERFKTLVRKMGLVDYWKARGWPDLCHPVGADDFACN